MRKPPQYRLHRPSGQAVVTLLGKDHYLGIFESVESWQKYHRLLLQHTTKSPKTESHSTGSAVFDRVPQWSPKRLRHTRLTEIRRLHGLEASKACVGHREMHYAEQNHLLARSMMKEQG